jgi:hypothetical protein
LDGASMSRNDTLEPSKKSRPSDEKLLAEQIRDREREGGMIGEKKGEKKKKKGKRGKMEKEKIFISLEICDFFPIIFLFMF